MFSLLKRSLRTASRSKTHRVSLGCEQLGDRLLPAVVGTPLPDLTGAEMHLERINDTIVAADIRIANEGDGNAAPFKIQWYLSTDTQLSSGDILLTVANEDRGADSYTHDAIIDSRLGSPFQVQLRLPEDRPFWWGNGPEHIVMRIDADNEVTELSETNNIAHQQVPPFVPPDEPGIEYFVAEDASGDETPTIAFLDGALRIHYGFHSPHYNAQISTRFELVKDGHLITTLNTVPSGSNSGGVLVNLKDIPNLTGGTYQVRAVTEYSYAPDGTQQTFSALQTIQIRKPKVMLGVHLADTFVYDPSVIELGHSAAATVVLGRGGTDTLQLNVNSADVASLNGRSLFLPIDSPVLPESFVIYHGSVFDSLYLDNGHEIYFQGIERLEFADGIVYQLSRHVAEAAFNQQWNLHVMDVPSAWRFTQGADNVLLVSLDSGLWPDLSFDTGSWPAVTLEVDDVDESRLIYGPGVLEDIDSTSVDDAHGNKALTVMAAAVNNLEGIAGINWYSDVMIQNVYGGTTLYDAIEAGINHALAHNQKVIFQGGIQGDDWLALNGATLEEFEALLSDHADMAFFSIAAGNGGIDIDYIPDSTDDYYGLSGGVARLQTTHGNVAAVGGFQVGTMVEHGYANAYGPYENPYNWGPSLTFVAPSLIPAFSPIDGVVDFNGTSSANPEVAAVASLVWSVNPDLTGEELRELLKDTAMDLVGTGSLVGRDDGFGHGLINADAAVRRALALTQDSALANLYDSADMRELHWTWQAQLDEEDPGSNGPPMTQTSALTGSSSTRDLDIALGQFSPSATVASEAILQRMLTESDSDHDFAPWSPPAQTSAPKPLHQRADWMSALGDSESTKTEIDGEMARNAEDQDTAIPGLWARWTDSLSDADPWSL